MGEASTEKPAGTASLPAPLRRERAIILTLLLALAAVSWLVLLRWRPGVGGEEMMGPTMGLGPLLFLAVWGVMMIAMMFPTAAPMILMFTRVQAAKRNQGQTFVPTWVFVAGYLIIWIAFGILIYGVALAAERAMQGSAWLSMNAARAGGALIVAAGLYQLSPLKRSCLAHCRTPLHFVLTRWRDGYQGALEMGLRHGLYCLGCCWLLFAILLPLGLMYVGLMALITLLIFAEKSLPISPHARVAAAAALIAYGAIVLVFPGALPTAMAM